MLAVANDTAQSRYAQQEGSAQPGRVENLHKSFGDLEVLKGVSYGANEGEVISLIGASGSGKSTLLRCINLLEMPTSGRIVVDGEEIRLGTDRKGRTIARDARQV